MLAASALLAAPALAGEPTSTDRNEAKRLYVEAHKLKGEGKLDEAVARFRRAHALVSTPVTRLDLARSLVDQAKLLEARALALSIPAMPITATETEKSKLSRREAKTLAEELDERIPSVTFVLGVAPEQEVAIDGEPLSKELLSAPVVLDPGDHVAVVRIGEKTADTSFSLSERESKSVPLAVPEPDEVAEPPPELAPKRVAEPKAKPRIEPIQPVRDDSRLFIAVPVLISVGGATLVAGAISGGVALAQAADLKDVCNGSACPESQRDALDTHDATATASTALFVIGGVVASAGAVVWIVDATRTKPAAQPSKVVLRWTGTGLAMGGTWP